MSAVPVAPRRRPSLGASLVALLGFAVAAAAAQPAGAPSALDHEAVLEYRLTEAALRKVIRATADMAELVKDPAVVKLIEAEKRAQKNKEEEEDEKEATLDELAALYDRLPPVRRAITNAGLTPREYVIFSLATALAGMAQWAADQGASAADLDLTPVQKANLAFVKRHEADFKRLGELTKALEGKEREEPAEREAPPEG
jgi:hypothetical protein